MRGFDRDLIRGGHYGQRSCEPHPKAEHMAAPTNPAHVKKALANSEPSTHGCTDQSCTREESSCQLGAVHTWPVSTVRSAATSWQLSGIDRTCRERGVLLCLGGASGRGHARRASAQPHSPNPGHEFGVAQSRRPPMSIDLQSRTTYCHADIAPPRATVP